MLRLVGCVAAVLRNRRRRQGPMAQGQAQLVGKQLGLRAQDLQLGRQLLRRELLR
jgi:hypothetical protein